MNIDNSMTIDQYHEHPAISRSVLGTAGSSKSAAHFHVKINMPKTGEALRFGNAFHKYVLEPDIYTANAVEWDGTATFGVKALEAEKDLADGEFLVLTKAGWTDQFKAMSEAIRSNSEANKLLSQKGLIEPSFFWHDDEYGVDVKCRPDFFIQNEKGSVIVDLKKTENSWKSAHENDFWKHVTDFNYDIQVYMNITGVELVTGKPVSGFIFIPVEDSEPYGVNCFVAGASVIESGRIKYRRYMEKYLEYKDSKSGYTQGLKVLELPDWYMEKLIEGKK